MSGKGRSDGSVEVRQNYRGSILSGGIEDMQNNQQVGKIPFTADQLAKINSDPRRAQIGFSTITQEGDILGTNGDKWQADDSYNSNYVKQFNFAQGLNANKANVYDTSTGAPNFDLATNSAVRQQRALRQTRSRSSTNLLGG